MKLNFEQPRNAFSEIKSALAALGMTLLVTFPVNAEAGPGCVISKNNGAASLDLTGRAISILGNNPKNESNWKSACHKAIAEAKNSGDKFFEEKKTEGGSFGSKEGIRGGDALDKVIGNTQK